MCYEKTLTKSENEISDYKRTPPYAKGAYQPYFHLNGFTHDYLYIIPQNSQGLWYPANWGLIPDYYEGDPFDFYKENKYNTLNARDDSVFTSNVYRNPIREGRCLIFADGFFEPHHYGDKLQPYFCHIPNGTDIANRELFTFAGIYSTDGLGSYYASIITVDANPYFSEIHNHKKRMPLVLDRKYEEAWIENGQSDRNIRDIMKDGFTTKKFKGYPISNSLYDKKIDTNKPEILIEVPSIKPLSLF